jgi:hypothetical protein
METVGGDIVWSKVFKTLQLTLVIQTKLFCRTVVLVVGYPIIKGEKSNDSKRI